MKSILIALSMIFSVSALAVDYNGTYDCNDGSILELEIKKNGTAMNASLDFHDGYPSSLKEISFAGLSLTGTMLTDDGEDIGKAKFDTIGKRVTLIWRSNPEKVVCLKRN